MTSTENLWTRLRKDDGYIFMMALVIFILLSATTIVIVGATQNQITQTRQNRQFTENRQGTTAALNDALNTLNAAGEATVSAVPYVSAATRKTGTAAKSAWSWYFTAATNTVTATSTAYGKTRTEAITVDYSDVESWRANTDGLPIYSVSARGAWKDAIAFNASSTGALTAVGSIGLYAVANFDTSGNTVTGSKIAIAHDDRAGAVVTGVTKSRESVTTTLDERTNKAVSVAQCSTWNPAFTGGSINTAETTATCYEGFNVNTPIAISGTGTKTIVIRDDGVSSENTLSANVTNPNGGQLHVIFTKRFSYLPLTLGSTSSSVSANGLFLYAPKSSCSSVGVGIALTGSLVCNNLSLLKANVTWLSPQLAATDGTSVRIWFAAK